MALRGTRERGGKWEGNDRHRKNRRTVLPFGFDRLILATKVAEQRKSETGRGRPSPLEVRKRRSDGLSAQRQIFISHRRDLSLGAHGPYYRDKRQFRRLISTRMIDRQTADTLGFCRFITRRAFPSPRSASNRHIIVKFRG